MGLVTHGRLAPLLAAAILGGAMPAVAQRTSREADRCNVVLDADQISEIGDVKYARGNVHVRCKGRNIHMYADSVVQFSDVAYFVSFPGKQIRYEDSTTTLLAKHGTYFKDNERFEARGTVTHRDKTTGSTFVGQAIDYFRPWKGVRNEVEVVGTQRPTLTYATRDSLGKPGIPIVVLGNRVRLLGRNRMYASGLVVLDRAELHGESDSLWLNADQNGGQLIGRASLVRRRVEDSFALTGKSIDLGMAKRELNSVKARDPAKLTGRDFQLLGDSILIRLVSQRPDRATSWGKKVRPQATSGEYQILGDSLVIEMPAQKLDRVKAFGKGWAGFGQPAAGTPKPPPKEKPRAADNWIQGDLVDAAFETVKSGKNDKLALREIKAQGKASCLYKAPPEPGRDRGSVVYTRADLIVILMRIMADSNVVDSVKAYGNVDSYYANPLRSVDTDTTSDTTAAARKERGAAVRAKEDRR